MFHSNGTTTITIKCWVVIVEQQQSYSNLYNLFNNWKQDISNISIYYEITTVEILSTLDFFFL